jgi:hypothetical protein
MDGGRTVEGGGKDGEPEIANKVGHVEQHSRRRHRRRHAARQAGADVSAAAASKHGNQLPR